MYRPDVQQGNIIDPAAFHQIAVGQSPAAVIKLLGTPLIRDPVHNNRWDYVAYYQTGHFEQPTRQDFTVFFKDGVVSSYELISRWLLLFLDASVTGGLGIDD